jgi:hypothetical protein
VIAVPQRPGLSCVIIVVVSIALYAVGVWAVLPDDIPSRTFWSRYFAIRDQPAPFAAGTLLYYFGITLCIAAWSFLPRRRILLRSVFGASGLLCAAAGMFYVCALLISSVDKIR